MNYEPNPHDSHATSDVDLEEVSKHHTIGEGPTQALSLVIAKRHFYTKDALDTTFDNYYTKAQVDADYDPSWVPSIIGTGWNPGNGTFFGRYKKFGRQVKGRAVFTLGTTLPTWPLNSVYFTLPVVAEPSIFIAGTATTFFFRSGVFANVYMACSLLTNSSGGTISLNTWGGTFPSVQAGLITASSPWVWAAGDQIISDFDYEADN